MNNGVATKVEDELYVLKRNDLPRFEPPLLLDLGAGLGLGLELLTGREQAAGRLFKHGVARRGGAHEEGQKGNKYKRVSHA